MVESNKLYVDVLTNSGFKEESTYIEENIPNDINKEKNKKYDHQNRKKNYMA